LLPESRIGSFLAGCLATLLAFFLGALLFIRSGLFEVAASKPHGPLVYQVVKTTMVHAVRLRARGTAAPPRFERGRILAGFCAYEAHCVTCHGALSVARDRWANGLTPDPPYLIDAPLHWTPGQLHWIITNGVKMTAMPAWGDSLSDSEVWNLVAFLETANRQPGAYVALRAANVCALPAAPPGKQPLADGEKRP